MQEDGCNCVPVACAKIIEIYGWIAPGSLPQNGKTPGGLHSVVMEFFSALLTTYDDDSQVELRPSVGKKVPVLGTNDESNITSFSASSIATQNEYITNDMAGNAIDEEQVNNQNANDKGLLILNELDMCQQKKYIDDNGLNFQPDCTDDCFDYGRRIIKCDICRRMFGLTMLESTSSFQQSVSTMDTAMISPQTCLP
jgi:hypothetical protein